jgi:hypothetical protein
VSDGLVAAPGGCPAAHPSRAAPVLAVRGDSLGFVTIGTNGNLCNQAHSVPRNKRLRDQDMNLLLCRERYSPGKIKNLTWCDEGDSGVWRVRHSRADEETGRQRRVIGDGLTRVAPPEGRVRRGRIGHTRLFPDPQSSDRLCLPAYRIRVRMEWSRWSWCLPMTFLITIFHSTHVSTA